MFRQLLAGAFVLSLASCARSTNEGTQEEHRIGTILPLTGGAALYGKWIQEGIDVAVTHLEQQHPGHRFRVIYQDDQNQPDRSINALNKLISFNNVPVIIGGVTSTCAAPIAPIAQSKSTVLVSTSASAPELGSVGSYFFRVWSSDDWASRQLANQVADRFAPRNIGLLYANNDYGQGVERILREEFGKRGVTVLASEGYTLKNTDSRGHLTRLKAAGPAVILLIGYASELAYAVRQASELDVDIPLVGQEGIESEILLKVAGKAAEGIIYYVPQFDPRDPDSTIQKFVETYTAQYSGRKPEIFAAHGYDAMMVIGDAILDGDDSADGIRNALAGTRDFPGVTGRITFDSNGDVRKTLMTKVVADGQFDIIRETDSK